MAEDGESCQGVTAVQASGDGGNLNSGGGSGGEVGQVKRHRTKT